MVGGDDRGRVLVFGVPGTIVLGPGGTPDAYLGLLTDPSVRRRHLAVTTSAEGAIEIEDLDTGGGTRISGKVVERAHVSSGALVEVGQATLRLVIVHDDRMTPGVPRVDASDYEIVEEIGHGAFSRVYEATERSTGRTVAVKRLLLAEERDRELLVSAFLREIETAAGLDHPGIAKVYAAGRRGDDVFLVLEYVDGPDLDACVRIDGPLPVEIVRGVARDVLDALGYAHERGVIHRDVKPSNVVLRGVPHEIRAMLVDFGLAIDASRDAAWGLTRTGDLRGTPEFLAPECLLDARAHSVQSDVFAVGATLCFALTGHTCRRPAEGPHTTAEALLRAEPISLAAYRPDVDERLAAVLERAIARSPADRWPSCRAFAAALAAAG